jgi:hypothetical protein
VNFYKLKIANSDGNGAWLLMLPLLPNHKDEKNSKTNLKKKGNKGNIKLVI